jgi:hypothetical protein
MALQRGQRMAVASDELQSPVQSSDELPLLAFGLASAQPLVLSQSPDQLRPEVLALALVPLVLVPLPLASSLKRRARALRFSRPEPISFLPLAFEQSLELFGPQPRAELLKG